MDVVRVPVEHRHEIPATVDGVALVRWPEQAAWFDELARMRRPQILLVAAGADPPVVSPDDHFAEWMRDPPDERELHGRIVDLRTRASAHHPILDSYGVLWRGADWIALSPIEARLMAAFLARPGRVLARSRLQQAGWPDGLNSRRAVDARITVLRPRIEPASIFIHTVRGHGYLAEIRPRPEH